jgi:signal transduction histidine kinase/CheY-like chemotaxis protein
MNMPLLNLEVRLELDIVLARQRARQIAALLGFAQLDQTRIATATSEIARNTVQYAGGGRVEFAVESGSSPALLIRIRERGPGINDLHAILEGEYVSSTGLGLGINGAKRLMDRFAIESTPGAGATVSMAKTLPYRATGITAQELGRISAELAKHAPQGLLEELQQQNRELLNTLQELRNSQAEIAQMHSKELDETNRGVVALYAELDEGTKALQRLSDLKSRFLSEMSHELRSPLNSIKGLTGFLLARSDGDLSSEQEKQIRFIRQAAEGLSTLVDDLLDLAKVEAGKAAIRIGFFEVNDLFQSLQGTIRPTIDHDAVSLVFEEPIDVLTLNTDEGKVAQILRNFLTNAVKFTERGQIRISAQQAPGDLVIFSVQDSGIGIAAENLSRIFEEFGQIDNPLQTRVKGTGLGLPLTRKLAQLLGGSVSVRSHPGKGSTFFATMPRVFPREDQHEAGSALLWEIDPARAPVLVVENDPSSLSLYEKHLEGSGYQVVPARTIGEAQMALRAFRPVAVILDILSEAESGWSLLRQIKAAETTRDIPVFVLTRIDDRMKALELGADDFCLKPVPQPWLRERLLALAKRVTLETALIVDDRERDRYLIKEALASLGRFEIIEAGRGDEALLRARSHKPDVIFLDLILPDMTGFEILDRLKSDAETRKIPVVINTSEILDEAERGRLVEETVAILAKGNKSREAAIAQVRDSLMKAGLRPPVIAVAES